MYEVHTDIIDNINHLDMLGYIAYASLKCKPVSPLCQGQVHNVLRILQQHVYLKSFK